MGSLSKISLKPYRALVCGASSGIGRATALALAELGAHTTVLARSADRLQELVGELKKAGASDADYVQADLNQLSASQEAVTASLDQHGPIHILINNTGGPPSGALLEAGEANFIKAYERHIFAAHMLVKLVLPGMQAADYGRIVNVLSTSVREPIANLGVSNTTRAAMASWAKSLSRELPPNISINCVLPGFTATDRIYDLADVVAKKNKQTREEVLDMWYQTIPEGRMAQPQEIANAIAFLVSPPASYIRGICLPVDGGRLNSI